jgi:hypothetical protein
MTSLDKQFWKIVKHNWTLDERADLRAHVEAWMAARK